MKNLTILLFLLFSISCFSQDWDKVTMKNVCSFRLPKTMEVRKESSLPDRGVKQLHKINEWSYNTDRITLQPQGMDAGIKTATFLYGRIIISIEEGNKGDFTVIEKMPRNDIELVKYMMVEMFLENSKKYGVGVLNITPVEIKKIGGKSAFYYSYNRNSSQKGNSSVFVQVYRILDDDKAIEITLSYRQSEKSIWHTDFNKFINSIIFN